MRRMDGENERKKGRGSSAGLVVKAAMMLLAILVSLQASEAATAATIDAPERTCNASIVGAACEDDDDAAGFLLDSESNRGTRRYLLQQGGSRSLGYPAIRSGDSAVCNAAPQYQSYGGNCSPSPSNPPGRGCRVYDRCRIGS